MTTRNDVEVTFVTSPRVAEVQAPSTEIVMQDLVDTLRKQEDTFEGMVFKKLINASGKEDLGGDVKVGITVAMQNLLLAFQGRTTPAQTGTVTAAPASPVPTRQIFQDSSATFITNGVQRGSFVVNFTDQSIADVVSVDSETQLTTKVLTEGIGNTYDVNDDYKVWNIIQVNATGGNLTAVDEFQAAISAVLPTAFTQVVLTASSSATLQEQADIRFASYDNVVSIRSTGVSGTDFPIGTRRQPVNNWVDALTIAQEVGLDHFYILDDQTVPGGLDLSGYHITGAGATIVTLIIPDSVNTSGMRVQDVMLFNSYMDQMNIVERCVVYNCEMGEGFYFQTAFAGTNTMVGTGQVNIFSCYSAVAGGGIDATPEFIVNGAIVAGRDWTGGVEFKSKTSTAGFSWDSSSGQIVVDDSCVAGDMTFRGIGKWTNADTYAGTANVIDEIVTFEDIQITRNMMEADQVFDKSAGLLHYYFKGTTTDIIPPKTVAGEQVATDVTLTE